MELTFLTGPVPLTKTITYAARSDSYTTSPYPMVQKVTSSVRAVANIFEFERALREEGARGACLLKGALNAPLVNESRARHALDNGHDWVCFDFDGVDCVSGRDGALACVAKYLPAALRATEFLVQLSSSAFRPTTRNFSGHLFACLDRCVSTGDLHEWLTWLNLNTALKDELRLTESGMGLHFPLDRTVASPAKLLYIAPPRCVGFTPQISAGDAIFRLPGRQSTCSIPAGARVAKGEEASLINTLREASGIPTREYKTHTHGDIEVLIDAEPRAVTDLRPSGEGFVRFNLGGGDSLGYFIDLKNPILIGNFKGEPYLKTQEVAPELFKALTKNQKAATRAATTDCSVEPLAFYATNRGSQIYVGSYDRARDELYLQSSNISAAYSWLAQYGQPLKPMLPHYEIVTDMTSDVRFEEGYPVINLFRQTEYLKTFADQPRTQPCDGTGVQRLEHECPLLHRVFRSALGGAGDAEIFFLNWLAAIVQRRTRTMSAWVLHGVQGTGKGLIYNHVLQPLLGEELTTLQNYSILRSSHNTFLEGKLLVVFDEADMAAVENWADIRARLYGWITEPKACINPKGKDERDVPNHANFLFFSNKPRPIVIEDTDRRFNVAEFQGDRLLMSPNDIAALLEQTELKALANLLGQWQIDDALLQQPYGGKAKAQIYEATHNLLDRTARAIREGDTQFFIDNRPDAVQMKTDYAGKMLPITEYDALLEAIVDGKLNVLTINDLYVLFRMVAISEKIFPETRATQRQIYQRYNLLPDKSKRDHRTKAFVKCIDAPAWQVDETIVSQIKKTDTTNVVEMPRR